MVCYKEFSQKNLAAVAMALYVAHPFGKVRSAESVDQPVDKECNDVPQYQDTVQFRAARVGG